MALIVGFALARRQPARLRHERNSDGNVSGVPHRLPRCAIRKDRVHQEHLRPLFSVFIIRCERKPEKGEAACDDEGGPTH
jgi:hypothetical protein